MSDQKQNEITPEDQAGNRRRSNSNQRIKKIVLFVVLPAILAAGAGYYLWSRGRVSTDDAFVDGHIYAITPRVTGYVVKVLVDDNQEVKKGQVLLTMDPTDYEVALASARAALAEARATLTSLELGVPLELSQTGQRVRAAKAELATLEQNLAAAQREVLAAAQDFQRAQAVTQMAALDLQRIKNLRQKKAVAQASLDQARTSYDSALAQERAARDRRNAAAKKRDALQADLERARAGIALAETGQDQALIKSRQVDAQRARVELAKAQLRQAELNLRYTQVSAPADGRVTRKNVEPGQMVAPGQSLMAVVPITPGAIWVIANYKETQLADVRPGQSASIKVDTYPGLELTGKVESIMAGTGAAFSLFPPENATGNYVKVVQRIPVKIVLDKIEGNSTPVLRLGMSVVPTIFTNK